MDTILPICICIFLGLNLLLLILLCFRKPADTSSALKEELRAVRQEQHTGQASLRREISEQLDRTNQLSLHTVSEISKSTLLNLETMRSTLDRRLEGMRRENQESMEQIRKSVDEQLAATLSAGLDQSFKSVSMQLEQVSKSIGEVQGMALDIQGLRNILANVKNRGTWGEIQLGSIIEDMFAPAQYEAQFAIANGNERVDYAIRLPGQGKNEVYLPIDSKFPMDRYAAYLSAEKQNNPALTATAKSALLRAVREQAKEIQRKYIVPPYTTDFAVLFVPSEGMYALLAAEDFAYTLQQEYKILLAGPSTLAALLNSLQMGFKTLAIQQKSADIQQLLRAVKKSMESFAKSLEASQKSLTAASNHLERASANARGIQQRMRNLEEMDIQEAQHILGEDYPDPENTQ